MPFTLIHAFSGYLIAFLITKNEKLRWLSFIGAALPDLDGLPLFWDAIYGTDYYYIIHRELFHPILAGIIFAVIGAIIAEKLWKVKKIHSFAFILLGFMMHALFDILFSDWYIPLFSPILSTQYLFNFLMRYEIEMSIIVTVLFLAAIISNKKLWQKLKAHNYYLNK